MKIRRIAGFAASVAVGALVLTACSSTPSDTESTTAAGGPSTGIVTANSSEPQNPLIPTNTNEVSGGKVLDLIFAGLVYYDAAGEAHNEVAESIETTDAQNYTIKLKADQKFTNGDPVTSKSFVDAWNYGALLTEGSAATSVDDANKLFQQAQEILFTDLPAIPLWYSNVTGGSATTVGNVEFGWNSVPLYYEVTKN